MRGDSRMIDGSKMTELWPDVIELAAVAASPIARRFNGYAEAEDLRSVATEYAVKRPWKVIEYLDREDSNERKRGERALIVAMRRECERYARKEKAERSGYRPEDEYFYRPMVIEKIIEVINDGGMELSGQVFDPSDMGAKRKTKPASEGGDLLAMIADVDAALHSLDDRTRAMMIMRHGDGMTLTDIARIHSVTPQRVEQVTQRGMQKMIEFLGGGNPY